jgi:hypothetical protein
MTAHATGISPAAALPRTVVWVSAGAASAVAAKITLREFPDAVLAYCHTGAEHEDNERFLCDLVRWFNRPIERLKSDEYDDTWDVYERTGWLAGPQGARCTTELKIAPRIAWQMPTDVHVFGYTADARDVKRAQSFRSNWFELSVRTPLIDAGITKSASIAMVERAGIDVPIMYKLGFHNNNCVACVKATSPDYWSLTRKHFPVVFNRMAELSRRKGARLCEIKGERRFIDEVPPDWPTTNPIAPSCDFLCHIAEQEIMEASE